MLSFLLFVTFVPSVFCNVVPLKDESSQKYGVVLDAGSSGTRIHVFSWTAKNGKADLNTIHEQVLKKYKPGFTAFSDDLDTIPMYLAPIINASIAMVPKEARPDTPIYLMATAGMRVLNEGKASLLMSAIRSTFYDRRINPFYFEEDFARILSGEEEGAFSWISVNYLLGFFYKDRPDTDSVGVLEMGGGSTQITFIPKDPIYQNKFTVRVAGRDYALYSHSYLFFGLRYIGNRLNRHLIENAVNTDAVDNPCALKGDKSTYAVGNRTINVIGIGNASECEQELGYFVYTSPEDHCHPKPCAIGTTYQPSVGDKTFYAVEGYTYAPKELGLLKQGSTITPQYVKDAAHAFCKKTLDEAVDMGIYRKYASSNCLSTVYIPMLLKAYGIPMNSSSVHFSSKINGEDTGWPLGAIIYEMSRTECLKTNSDGKESEIVVEADNPKK